MQLLIIMMMIIMTMSIMLTITKIAKVIGLEWWCQPVEDNHIFQRVETVTQIVASPFSFVPSNPDESNIQELRWKWQSYLERRLLVRTSTATDSEWTIKQIYSSRHFFNSRECPLSSRIHHSQHDSSIPLSPSSSSSLHPFIIMILFRPDIPLVYKLGESSEVYFFIFLHCCQLIFFRSFNVGLHFFLLHILTLIFPTITFIAPS